MLRNLPGVLSDFVIIREETISAKTGLSTETISKQLKKLESLNFLLYIPRNDKPQIQYLTERLNTSNISLSDEIYRNRKDDANRRVQAVIDFVNNDKECRSVQLLRYFGEDIKKTCNKCDVCSSKNKININEKEYQEISENIVNELRENDSNIYEVLNNNKEYHDEKVIGTLRWMIDNDVIYQDEEGFIRLKRKD